MIRKQEVNESNLLECEVISYCKNGDPPRPMRLRVEIDSQLLIGKITKVRDKTLERYMGNVMYRYFCEAVLDNQPQFLELKYERDTMKWFLYRPGTTQEIISK